MVGKAKVARPVRVLGFKALKKYQILSIPFVAELESSGTVICRGDSLR